MFIQIDDLLSPQEVHAISELARQTRFVDGRRTNPHNTTKVNAIADATDPMSQKASQLALAALQRCESARDFVFPLRMAVPNLCRYGVAMKYGPHTDAAFLLLVGEPPLRSDVSCTIFISNPMEYEGGELIIHLGSETLRIKGKPGSAVFYPSTTVHEVMPVTSGERLVIITFIESQIPDQMQRDLLYTLREVRALEGLKMDWRNQIQLEYVIANLHRMWSK
jgi:PKHD-type hydroxylase